MQEKGHLNPRVEVAASKIRSWAVVVWKELAVYWNLAVQRDPALGQMSTIYNKYLNSYEWADSRSADVSSRNHDLARSWFQIWPIFGDGGNKISKNYRVRRWRWEEHNSRKSTQDEIQTLGLVSRPGQQREGGEEQTLFSFLQNLDLDSILSPPL